MAEVLAAARARAARAGLGPADRVLSTLEWSTLDGLADGLLAVLAAGASLVQCRNADPAALEHRAATESHRPPRLTRRRTARPRTCVIPGPHLGAQAELDGLGPGDHG